MDTYWVNEDNDGKNKNMDSGDGAQWSDKYFDRVNRQHTPCTNEGTGSDRSSSVSSSQPLYRVKESEDKASPKSFEDLAV